MRTVGLKTLKNKLSEYVRLAAAGETVVVTDRGRTVAEIVPPRLRKRANPISTRRSRGLDQAGGREARTGRRQRSRYPGYTFEQLMADLDRDREDRVVIYVDSSVALAHLLAEPRSPPEQFWERHLASSRLLEYEVWNRVHARGLTRSHGERSAALLARINMMEMSQPCWRALRAVADPVPDARCACTSRRWNFCAGTANRLNWRATTIA